MEDLKRRFALLEGERKASHDTADMSKKQNQEIMAQLKEENRSLRTQIGKLREEKPQTAEDKLERAMSAVQALQRRYDTLKALCGKKRSVLDNLSSKLAELSMGAKLNSSEASPEMRHIRVLENRLDKAMIKHCEAQTIRKTYASIVRRLKEERVGFDSQLQNVEASLTSKEREYEELLLLSHDAYHAKEMAQAELHRFEQGVAEERKQRDKEVQEKKALVEQRVAMNKKLEEHQKKMRQEEAERGDERQLRDVTCTDQVAGPGGSDLVQDDRQKLDDYEDAFLAIKDATGVADVNEVIQKFLTQEDTHKSLTQLAKERQSLVDKLTDERSKFRLQVEEWKFSKGGAFNRRQAIDEREKKLTDASEKCARSCARHERLAKLLIDMEAGIDHLAGRLVPVQLENERPLEMSDENVEEVLTHCDMKIGELLRLTQVNDVRMVDDARYEEKMMLRHQADAKVKLGDKDDDADDDDDDGYDEDMCDMLLSRAQVKSNSTQFIERKKSKSRRKGKAPQT